MEAKKVRGFLNESNGRNISYPTRDIPDDIINLMLDIGDMINDFIETDYPIKNMYRLGSTYIGEMPNIGNLITLNDISKVHEEIKNNFSNYADNITFDHKSGELKILIHDDENEYENEYEEQLVTPSDLNPLIRGFKDSSPTQRTFKIKIIHFYEKIVKESINEILKDDRSYEINLIDFDEFENEYDKTKGFSKFYRYSFITKDNIKYDILLSIKENGKAKIDFDTKGLDNENFSSIIHLINAGDTIKVLNTLKKIIDKHRKNIKKLIINSTPERINFYKKVLDYLNIENYKYDEYLVGIL